MIYEAITDMMEELSKSTGKAFESMKDIPVPLRSCNCEQAATCDLPPVIGNCSKRTRDMIAGQRFVEGELIMAKLAAVPKELLRGDH